jgi:hypothetical protein
MNGGVSTGSLSGENTESCEPSAAALIDTKLALRMLLTIEDRFDLLVKRANGAWAVPLGPGGAVWLSVTPRDGLHRSALAIHANGRSYAVGSWDVGHKVWVLRQGRHEEPRERDEVRVEITAARHEDGSVEVWFADILCHEWRELDVMERRGRSREAP